MATEVMYYGHNYIIQGSTSHRCLKPLMFEFSVGKIKHTLLEIA